MTHHDREPNGLPVLVDLYSCQGGAARGYQLAGYYVIGVDIAPQPRYCGDEFVQGDAIAFIHSNLEWIRNEVALVHASPPCQRYSRTQQIQQREHPDLIAPTREILQAADVPFVIENVEEARSELIDPVMLCGAMFGLRTYRHRLFETGGGFAYEPPAHPAHVAPLTKMGRPRRPGEFAHYVGNFSGVEEARLDMQMPWANRDGLREAIPPAYAEAIGSSFAAQYTAATESAA